MNQFITIYLVYTKLSVNVNYYLMNQEVIQNKSSWPPRQNDKVWKGNIHIEMKMKEIRQRENRTVFPAGLLD